MNSNRLWIIFYSLMASSPLRLFSTSGRKEKIQRESFWFRESEELKKKTLSMTMVVHQFTTLTRESSQVGAKRQRRVCVREIKPRRLKFRQ